LDNIVDADQALLIAAEEGNLEKLKGAIEIGANVNCQRYSNKLLWETPLHCVAREGRVRCVEYLLECKANPNCQTKLKEITPLHEVGTLKVCQMLIEAEADVNAVNYDGNMPIHKHCSPPIVLELLRAKACINVMDNENNTLLHQAAEGGNVDVLKILLEWTSDECLLERQVFRDMVLDTQKRFPQTVAHLFAQMITPLNTLEASVRNNDGQTALDVAKYAHGISSFIAKLAPRIQRPKPTYAIDYAGTIAYLRAYNARSDSSPSQINIV